MTDEQIIKALECCFDTPPKCEECAYKDEVGLGCIRLKERDALALIKRQREEIARLTAERDEARRDCAVAERNHAYAEAERAEAIRDFAERMSTHIGLLEEKAEEDCAEMCRFLQNATIELHAKRSAYRDVQKCMSEIVEEMTEEQE